MPFCNITHSIHERYILSWGDVLYNFVDQAGFMGMIPTIVIYKKCKDIESKGIYLGLVFWNTWEVLQEFNVMLKFNLVVFDKLDPMQTDIMQVVFMNALIFFTYKGSKKWSTSSPSLSRT